MVLSQYTHFLAESFCGGSSRKLIAGWWYSILGMTLLLTALGVLVLGSRRRFEERLVAIWSGLMLCGLSVGGTMIMRKFHTSYAVGLFMGSLVAMSQMFFMLFLIYIGYHKDSILQQGQSGMQEAWMAFFALGESILLATFAAILAAHRSEILEKPGGMAEEVETVGTYDAPSTI